MPTLEMVAIVKPSHGLGEALIAIPTPAHDVNVKVEKPIILLCATIWKPMATTVI